jgi:SAM-dependent methyltransferase
MTNEIDILKKVRGIQKEIELFYLKRILPKVFSKSVRQTRHFDEWFAAPMNYVRIIELPLTHFLMDLDKDSLILDISSPKFLSLYLGTNGFPDITISDVEDYFVEDFKIYAKNLRFSPRIETFDATNIPFEDNSFDRVFSISALEHVPDNGDREIAREVARILKKDGIFVITAPASNSYCEEWLKEKNFYWPTKIREDGRAFFQRRYDEKSIRELFGSAGFRIEDIIFIAERPIKEPKLNANGRLLYNAYYLKDFKLIKILEKLNHRSHLPLLPYLAYRLLSYRHHYLTRDGNDRNIRQAAVKMCKKHQ